MKSAGPGRGHFETMEVQGDSTRISGWIFHPDVATTAITLEVDGVPIQEAVPIVRETVAAAFPWIAHAGHSGFQFEVPRSAHRQRARVEAREHGRVLTGLRITLGHEFDDLPRPPAELMQRVSGSPDPRFFDADGVRSYTEFSDAVAKYGDWASIRRMLDWGCGCGRVTRCFLRVHPEIEVHGCDIDAQAVAWCSENLPAGHFRATQPLPPTGYPDSHFPLVIGYSVFTHLDADLQHAWLEEIRRIVTPGGLFMASVNGHLVARFAFPPTSPAVPRPWYQRWRKIDPVNLSASGFVDAGEDVALKGVAPSGYYRGVFQSPEWTRREWSKHFRVLAILEGGMQNYQDLVILQRV